jgi:hypothetical protein
MQKNGSQLPASHFVLKKRVPISAWEQQEQQVLFLQEQQERQQVQLQEQESAWRSADPLQEQQEQEQQQEPVPGLLLFSCSRLRKQEPWSGKVRVRSSFSCDTFLFPFVLTTVKNRA